MTERIYRVQDIDGRGPYRPGLTAKWSDNHDPAIRLPFFQEFGDDLILQMNDHFSANGGACGCGFRSIEQAVWWFTPAEQVRLHVLGFPLVSMQINKIFAESDKQLVFWRGKPLRQKAVIISWPTKDAP